VNSGIPHDQKRKPKMITGKKDRKTNMEIKKLYCVVPCNKFMKSIDRADQYHSNSSVLRNAVKWSKKVM
jgi:hypothetical protein